MSKTILRGELAGYGYVPPGGETGQILVKISSVDGDTRWETLAQSEGTTIYVNNGTTVVGSSDVNASAIVADAQSAVLNSPAYLELAANVSALSVSVIGIGAQLGDIGSRITSVQGALESVNTALTSALSSVDFQRVLASAALTSAIGVQAIRIDTIIVASNEIYVTVSAPSVSGASATGAIWYDSDDGNHPYRWIGTEWVDIQDAAISVNYALILAEQSLRAELSAAYVSDLAAIQVEVDSNSANIVTESLVRASTSAVFASQLNAILVNVGSLSASIINESQVRASSSAVLATQINAVQANVGSLSASFLNEVAVRVSTSAVFASEITALKASTSVNYALILNESSVRAATSAAFASLYTGIAAVANSKNRIYTQSGAPVSALTTGDVWFRTTLNNQPYTWDGSTWVSVADPRIDVNAAAITSEATVRASTSAALASQITTVQAAVSSVNAVLVNEVSVRANTSAALASQIITLQASVSAANGAIVNEINVRASTSAALAGSISTLTSRVGSAEATIQTQATTINGMSASYFVKTDVNGHVAGIGLWNNSSASEFYVIANRFAVVTSAGAGPFVPFIVSGSTVFMQDVVIGGDLIVDGAINTARIEDGAVGISNSFTGSGSVNYASYAALSGSASLTAVTGKSVLVVGALTVDSGQGLTDTNVTVYYRVMRGTTAIYTASSYWPRTDESAGIDPQGPKTFPLIVVDSPGAGTFTYTIQAYKTNNSLSVTETHNLYVQQLKR